MAEETSTTETTVKKSSGSVKIDVEEYNDLMRRANEPKQIYNPVYTTVEKTPEMAANDLVTTGNVFLFAGVAQVVIGGYLRLKGLKALKAL